MAIWSIYWRLLLLLLAMGLVFGVLVNAAYLGNITPTAIRWKPTIIWLLEAVLIWVAVSAAPKFLEKLLFAERLNLSPQAWLKIGRYTCLLLITASISSLIASWLFVNAWPTLKITIIPAGLLVIAFFVAPRSGLAHAKES